MDGPFHKEDNQLQALITIIILPQDSGFFVWDHF